MTSSTGLESEIVRFINSNKALLIAPAGHGKTHTISQCVNLCSGGKSQLILTHTHAGISSIRQKLNQLNVSKDKYVIQTITGFAQNIVHAYFGLDRLGIAQDEKPYFKEIINKCASLLQLESVQSVMLASYSGIFVDEYQDCIMEQHRLIMCLSSMLPTRLLGDPLQSIYDFDGVLVDFKRDLREFEKFNFLRTPYRWQINENSPDLGERILRFRNELELDGDYPILLTEKSSHFHIHDTSSISKGNFAEMQTYYSRIGKWINSMEGNSILVIIPAANDSGRIMTADDRAELRQRMSLQHSYKLVEPIDEKGYYSSAKDADSLICEIICSSAPVKDLFNFLTDKLKFEKVALKKFLNITANKIINKRGDEKILSDSLHDIYKQMMQAPSATSLLNIISFFKEIKANCKRTELLHAVVSCIRMAIENGDSIHANMCKLKNKIRVQGRKVQGKYIGTTLLTKGLEFDTVVIIDAHNIKDKRNFYVAISRACKDLHILSDQKVLSLAP